jgi:L-lysine exporter family protein LysE/ArgO
LARLIASCFAVTWLNPQAVIDASLLMGGYRASLPPGASTYFILGVCLASASWFSGISVLVAVLRARFNAGVVRWINIVCGAALVVYGIRLALETL